MPLYEYECSYCNYRLEKLVYNYEINCVICPRCNNQMYKNISNNTFILSGSCWAKDGYQ